MESAAAAAGELNTTGEPAMTTKLILHALAITLSAIVSAHAQNLSSDDLARRTVERARSKL